MNDGEYEEWIAHPDKRVFVHREDRWDYARRPGWWATERFWSDMELAAAGYRSEARARQVRPGMPPAAG